MVAMDTKHRPDDISELADTDPAEAPELADRIVERLSAELAATEEGAPPEEAAAAEEAAIVDEPALDVGADEDGAVG